MNESRNRWAFRALAVSIAVGIWLPASYCPRLREMTVPPIEESVQARVTTEDHDQMVVLGSPILGSPEDPREELFILIRGSEDAIASLNRDQIRVRVPLGENLFGGATYGGPRQVAVILSTENVVLPEGAEGIEVVSLTPEQLTLTLDEEISVQVPVQVDWRGEPIGGFSVDYDNVRIEPRLATVRGSRSEINRLGYALAGPIDINGRGLGFVEEQARVRFESEHVVVEFPTFVSVEVPMIEGRQPQSGAGS
jgi:hypothetical protein